MSPTHSGVEDWGRKNRRWQRNKRGRSRRRKKKKDRTQGISDTVCCYVKRKRK